ncbi:MAG: Gfo/Idh/MocA family oxidoreductase [Planctomycetes bacterium]|nr:Gfo/Idh/MocA family oxidoreductase [Planctomycetota bacterium]
MQNFHRRAAGRNRERSPVNVSRRQALGTFAAGLLATGFWSEARGGSFPSANDKLNLGVIGVANRGETNLIGVNRENIVALCDVDEDYLGQAAMRYRGARRFADYRQLLDMPKLDAVVISSPDHTHAHASILALDRGLHVYCEKPLATTMREARAMAERARNRGRVTQTGAQHHTSEGYRRAVKLMRSDLLGEVREIHAWTNRPFWPQGVGQRPAEEPVPAGLNWDLWLGPAEWRPYAAAYHPTNWRGFWDFGTGALGDRGPHLLDPVLEGLQLSLPERIVAESSGSTRESPPEWSIVRFEFPARQGGPPRVLTWYDGGKQPALEVAGARDFLAKNGVVVVGAKARLFLPELGGDPLVLAAASGSSPADVAALEGKLGSAPPGRNHYEQWLDACKGHGKTECDFEYGARLTQLCLLGNIALRAGEPIRWNAQDFRVEGSQRAAPLIDRAYRKGWEFL